MVVGMRLNKLIISGGILASLAIVSVPAVNGQALAEDAPIVVATATPTPAPTPEIFPTPTNFVCAVISNSRAQLTRTREQWENECYSNPFTDEEMAHEPNAADLTHPGYDASPEAWSDWYGARVESCKVLTKDAEYIECMYRPWIYGF
jgi:hypothetical protein